MNTRTVTVFGPRFMLAMLLAAFATFAAAQEGPDESPQPAVETSAMDDFEPAVDTSAVTDEELPAPAATTAAVAADVKRQETGSGVMDRLELGRTEITGNQELPKVLYIVPWQKSDPGELMGRPVNTLLDEVLAPLDREEFMRQVEYYDDLHED